MCVCEYVSPQSLAQGILACLQVISHYIINYEDIVRNWEKSKLHKASWFAIVLDQFKYSHYSTINIKYIDKNLTIQYVCIIYAGMIIRTWSTYKARFTNVARDFFLLI